MAVQGQYSENLLGSVFSGAISGAAIPGFTVPGAIVGGLLGLGKGIIENKAAQERASQVDKQKALLLKRKKELQASLQAVPSMLEEQTNILKENLDYEAQSSVDKFIESTVGSIQDAEKTKARTGLSSSDIDVAISTSREKAAKTFADLRRDVSRRKDIMDYELESNKASRIQELLGEMYNIDTTVEGL